MPDKLFSPLQKTWNEFGVDILQFVIFSSKLKAYENIIYKSSIKNKVLLFFCKKTKSFIFGVNIIFNQIF